MSLNEKLETVFKQFLSNRVSREFLRSIKESVTAEDVDVLMKNVESLGDPSEYCESDYDKSTVSGFFLYLDFISALIIQLGAPALKKVKNYSNTAHPFVPWVVKYADDSRFHKEIISKFSDVFTA